jgi:hypothetical protein
MVGEVIAHIARELLGLGLPEVAEHRAVEVDHASASSEVLVGFAGKKAIWS